MKKGFGIITVALVLVIVFCVKGIVFSKENDERARQNHYYAQMEDEYLAEVKEVLKERGCDNCGVTMTRVMQEDGSREYRVLMHHKKLDRLSGEEREELVEALSDREFAPETCRFCYAF